MIDTFFTITSLALGQSQDCPSASEVILKDIHSNQWPIQYQDCFQSMGILTFFLVILYNSYLNLIQVTHHHIIHIFYIFQLLILHHQSIHYKFIYSIYFRFQSYPSHYVIHSYILYISDLNLTQKTCRSMLPCHIHYGIKIPDQQQPYSRQTLINYRLYIHILHSSNLNLIPFVHDKYGEGQCALPCVVWSEDFRSMAAVLNTLPH